MVNIVDEVRAQAIAEVKASKARRSSLAQTGYLPDFHSTTAAFPRLPVQQELLDFDVIRGFRTVDGRQQPVDYNRGSSAWADAGAITATFDEVTQAQQVADDARTRLSGVSNQASQSDLPDGPAGIPEVDARALKVQGGVRFERIPYGIGGNAAVQSIGNIPGQRTGISGVNNLAELAGYGFDMATQFLGFDISASIFEVPTGVATFTSGSMQAAPSSIPWSLIFDDDGHLRKGIFVRTTHPERWYAPVVAADRITGTLTVTAWRKGSDQLGPIGTPANGTGAVAHVNPIDAAFVRNLVLGILPDSPIRLGRLEEGDIYLAGGDARADGYIVVMLGPDGSSSSGAGYVVRRDVHAGRLQHGLAVLGGAYQSSIYSGPDPVYGPDQPRPQWDGELIHGTAGNLLLRGDCDGIVKQTGDGTEVYRLRADGVPIIQGVPQDRTYAKGFNKDKVTPTLKTWTRVPMKGDAGHQKSDPFSVTDGAYHVPHDGMYTLSGLCTIIEGAVGNYVITAVAVNGTRLANLSEFYMSGPEQGIPGGAELPLVAGDVVELQVYLGTGGAVYGDPVNQASTWLSVTRLY